MPLHAMYQVPIGDLEILLSNVLRKYSQMYSAKQSAF